MSRAATSTASGGPRSTTARSASDVWASPLFPLRAGGGAAVRESPPAPSPPVELVSGAVSSFQDRRAARPRGCSRAAHDMDMWTPEIPCILLMFAPPLPIIAPACARGPNPQRKGNFQQRSHISTGPKRLPTLRSLGFRSASAPGTPCSGRPARRTGRSEHSPR